MAIPEFPKTCMKFRAWHSLLSPVFVVYADLETHTRNIAEEGQDKSKSSRKINELEPFMIAYFIKFTHSEKAFTKHPHLREFETVQMFEGETCLEQFFIKLKEDCYKIKSTVRTIQSLIWNSDLEEKFQSEKKCGICQAPYKVKQDCHVNWHKVRHHDHVTGELCDIF